MKAEILNIIKRIYFEKDYELFREKQAVDTDYFSELIPALRTYVDGDEDISEFEYDINHNQIHRQWDIDYPVFNNNGCEIRYFTKIQISKIAPVYYLFHGFWQIQFNSESYGKNFANYDDDAYTYVQEEVKNIIVKHLDTKGLTRLFKADMGVVIPKLSMIKDFRLGEPQMTIENALFYDPYNILLIPENTREDKANKIIKKEKEKFRVNDHIEELKLDIEEMKKWNVK